MRNFDEDEPPVGCAGIILGISVSSVFWVILFLVLL